jgi:hypothetical protein
MVSEGVGTQYSRSFEQFKIKWKFLSFFYVKSLESSLNKILEKRNININQPNFSHFQYLKNFSEM